MDTLPSSGQFDPILGDLTPINSTIADRVNDEDFDILLNGGNAEMPTELLPVVSDDSTVTSPEDLTNSEPVTRLPAFPGAEGFGALSVGGRGGRVIEVTNLYDSGPGSLREALEAEGPRIVVFRVAGIIRLKDTIRIKNPYLTVAGQTAPGGGILLRGDDATLIRIEDGAHDITIRYLRLRSRANETETGHDNISINGGHDIILDRLSLSWSTDENASIWRKHDDPPIYNVTIQRSILGEGLDSHSNGLLIGGETDFRDPDRPIEAWREVKRIAIHHNLFVHNNYRNPRVTSRNTQIVNNVIYNWKNRIGETTRGAVVDYINNYAKAGPVSNLDRLFLHENFSPLRPDEPYPNPSIYTEGNIVDPVQTDPSADNWNLWKLNFSNEPVPLSYRRSNPLRPSPIPINIESAEAAYDSVLADSGANARLNCIGEWVPNADAVDRRYIDDLLNYRGENQPITHPHEVGGYPEIEPGTPCTDSDGDGMPNAWENLHDLNPQDPSDGSADADGDGYTNVEEYLNGSAFF
ncbi:MAG: hypothetical protein D6728_14740 [Cyanobacteria bacterium J055]|nr:MAG: hypothetical protein D6728_14740 [Cyanobacteria bacterium J055]